MEKKPKKKTKGTRDWKRYNRQRKGVCREEPERWARFYSPPVLIETMWDVMKARFGLEEALEPEARGAAEPAPFVTGLTHLRGDGSGSIAGHSRSPRNV